MKSPEKSGESDHNSEDISSKEQLLKKFKLTSGSKAVFKKIKKQKSSSVDVGAQVGGTLKKDVQIGEPVEFTDNSNRISKIVDVGRQANTGDLLLQTTTSIYKLVQNKEKRADTKALDSLEKTIREAREQMSEHPEGVQNALENYGDDFVRAEVIGGKQFIFSKRKGKKVIALVKDDGQFKVRAFRRSTSDRQWKSLPGYRAMDEGDSPSSLKGDESDPNNHYVQSTKLDKRVYQTLDQLEQTQGQYDTREKLLPHMGDKVSKQRADEFEFSETQVELNSDSWRQTQIAARAMENIDTLLGTNSRSSKNIKKFCQTYKDWIEITQSTDAADWFREQQDDGMSVLEAVEKKYEKLNSNDREVRIEDTTLIGMRHHDDEDLQRFYHNFIPILQESFAYLQKVVNEHVKDSGIAPEFSEHNKIDSYTKHHPDGDIRINEFLSTSDAGDKLVWAMAHDEKGRVYIDNIYAPDQPIDSYGTPEKKVNMGILVQKPLEYYIQDLTIPENKKEHAFRSYDDISSFLEDFEPVKRYKQYL